MTGRGARGKSEIGEELVKVSVKLRERFNKDLGKVMLS
jgi:hypothetical protein